MCYNKSMDYDDDYGMSPEEAGYADGEFDSQNGGIDGASYGASIDLDSLTDDERDEYESAYYSGLDG